MTSILKRRSTFFLPLRSLVVCLNFNSMERLLLFSTKTMKQCAQFFILTHSLTKSLVVSIIVV
jgi:hypothetical protein